MFQYENTQKVSYLKYLQLSPDFLHFLHSCQYIIENDEKIIKFRIDQTESVVKMATERFSYIIHCNFEIVYLRNTKCYRDGLWCGNTLCQTEAFLESIIVYVTWIGGDA